MYVCIDMCMCMCIDMCMYMCNDVCTCRYIKDIPSVEARNAELCLFKHRPQDAEAILLQAPNP